MNRSATLPVLVGHSLGGPVACRLAMDYPALVGGLVLVAPSIDPALEKQEWYRPLLNWGLIRKWLPVEFDASNREILPLRRELTEMLPLWRTIRVPVTVIQGDRDILVPPGNAAFAGRMLTSVSARIIMLPGQNHFIPWTRPEVIREAILGQAAGGEPSR